MFCKPPVAVTQPPHPQVTAPLHTSRAPPPRCLVAMMLTELSVLFNLACHSRHGLHLCPDVPWLPDPSHTQSLPCSLGPLRCALPACPATSCPHLLNCSNRALSDRQTPMCPSRSFPHPGQRCLFEGSLKIRVPYHPFITCHPSWASLHEGCFRWGSWGRRPRGRFAGRMFFGEVLSRSASMGRDWAEGQTGL